MQLLKSKKIILASSSPRRKKLLQQLNIPFIIDPSAVEELIDENQNPNKIVEQLSIKKAKEVGKRHKNAVIIAADTLVFLENKIFGKPKTEKDAFEMLKKLSGKTHTIITGLTVLDTSSKKITTNSVKTTVYMKNMTDKEINWYIQTKEPFDKAGGYGIQELGVIFIEKIEGDYSNVVGLPLFLLYDILSKHEVFIL